ncbi:MAG: LON peptidase substrate-binding domain-containing protein, partial [Chloroflexota bacterium]
MTDETLVQEQEPTDVVYIEKPLLIIKDTVLFPKVLTPVALTRDSELRAIEAANAADAELIVVTQYDATQENPTADDVYRMGIRAVIMRHLQLPQGGANVLLQGQERIELADWVQTEPYPIVKGRKFNISNDFDESSLSIKAQMRTVMALFERYANLHAHIPDDAFVAAANIHSPGWLTDFISSVIEVSIEQQQEILDILDPVSRLTQLSILLARELDVLELEDRIQNQVQQTIDKSQREYFLREQIRIIQNELGETDSAFGEITELQGQLDDLVLPEEVEAKAQKELNRLASMPFMAPETGVIRTYLDWIIEIPWTATSEASFDVQKAECTLESHHYGLNDVKERILEYISVRARVGEETKLRTPILCFVGPP